MRKTKVLAVISFLILSSGWVGGQQKTYSDGNMWETMTPDKKTAFIQGIYEGSAANFQGVLSLVYGTKFEWPWKMIEEFMDNLVKSPYMISMSETSREQMNAGINELYRDYANKHIPIFAIATLVNKRITGKIKTEDVEKELQKLRAMEWK